MQRNLKKGCVLLMMDTPQDNTPQDPEENPEEKAMKEAAEKFFAMFTQKATGKVTLKDVMHFMRVINFNLGQLDKKLTIIASNQEELSKAVQSLIDAHDYLKKVDGLHAVDSERN